MARTKSKAPQSENPKKRAEAAVKSEAQAVKTAAVLSKGEKTRQLIVGHATIIIHQKGYGKTTIEDVIAAAGITKGSFYFHFASKEELGYAVVENVSSYITARVEKALEDPDLTPYQRIEAILKEIQSIVGAADCSRGCILGNLGLEMSHTNVGFSNRIAQIFKAWASLIESELEEMKRVGQLASDFDCVAYANFAISSLEGGIMMSKVTRDATSIHNSVDLTLKLLTTLSKTGTRD
jgi:TetR/AcrR family transcriptional repressor of nem operon